MMTWTLAVMIPPLFIAHSSWGLCTRWGFWSMFGFASRRRLSEVWRYEAQACVLRRRARTNSKLKPTTTRH